VAGFCERRLQLQEAAGISRGHYVCPQRGDEAGFAVAEFGCRFRLDEIVDSGGAAADGRFGNFEQLRAGNLLKQCPGLRTNALGVLQVAGIVKSHAGVERLAFGARGTVRREFR